MDFKKLLNDTKCECLNGSFEDVISHYGIKTNKNTLNENVFKSKVEKGEVITNKNCKVVCGKKGISMSKINSENCQKAVLNIYCQLFPVTPAYKPYLSIVKFKTDAGLLKDTPSNMNDYHHDFYKCDTFTLDHVELIKSIPLSDHV